MAIKKSKPKKDFLNQKIMDKFCDDMLHYFDIEPYREIESESAKGTKYTKFIANRLPTIEGFARTQGISSDKIRSYADKYPEVLEAMLRCYDMMYDMLLNNSLMGMYDSSSAVFAQKNLLKFSDKIKPNTPIVSGDNNNINIGTVLMEVMKDNESKGILDR